MVLWKKRDTITKIGLLAKNLDFWNIHRWPCSVHLREKLWKPKSTVSFFEFFNFLFKFGKKKLMDLWPILRFWPWRKNGRFSIPTLRVGSIVSQGHFLGDPDQVWSKIGVLALLRHPLLKIAKISLRGRYLWNSRSTSKNEESGLRFLLFWS